MSYVTLIRRGAPLLSSLANRRRNQQQPKRKSFFSGGFSLTSLPAIILIGLLIWLIASGALSGLTKGLKSIFNLFGDTSSGAKDWLQYGGAGQAENIKGQLEQMKAAAKRNGIEATPISRSKAIDLHNAINAYHPFSLSSMLTKAEAVIVRDIFITNPLIDQARILLAYGEQPAPSRLLIWNVLWDDTSGTFRDHVTRFVPDGETKVQILHYVDYATKTYLT